jgi:hypothetical protein
LGASPEYRARPYSWSWSTITGLADEYLRTAVNALIPPPAPTDTRTAAQRSYDALEELANSYLETTNTTTTGGEKPHINVHCDIGALKGEPGGLHETTAGQVLAVKTIHPLPLPVDLTWSGYRPAW